MSDFPRMLYQVGDQVELNNGWFNYIIVDDQDALDILLNNGWYMTSGEAKDANIAPAPEPVVVDDATPTRAEMEAKAAELGVKFDGRTRDAKLLSLITEALGA